MRQVKFSAHQLDEAVHKTAIVCEEIDLQDSYDLTTEQTQEFLTLLNAAKPGLLMLPEQLCEMLVGEFENALEIAHDNIEAGDDEWKAYRRSIRAALRMLA